MFLRNSISRSVAIALTSVLLCQIAFASQSPDDKQAFLYVEEGQYTKAIPLLKDLLKVDSKRLDVMYALSESYLQLKQYKESMITIDQLLDIDPNHVEALFLKAELFEAERDLWKAIHVYDLILSKNPASEAAYNLKMRAYLELGAITIVEQSPRSFDAKIKDRIDGDKAVKYLSWDESKASLALLNKIIYDFEQLTLEELQERYAKYQRARFDRIVVMRNLDMMEEVVAEYKILLSHGWDLPDWVIVAVADAYLYLENPDKASMMYWHLYKTNPKDLNIRLALYNVLVELGQFEDADAILYFLNKETPAEKYQKGVVQDNWEKVDLDIDRAWLLMYQNYLHQSDQYIHQELFKAPFNTSIRIAQARNHAWRGWPRRSLHESQIAGVMDPESVSGRISESYALYDNHYKEQAVLEALELHKQYPANKHVERLLHSFEMQQATVLDVGVQFITENPGSEELTLNTKLTQPIGYNHNLFIELWRRENFDSSGNVVGRKAYLGDHWDATRWLNLTAAVTADYEQTQDLDVFLNAELEPNDRWMFGATFDGNYFDIPVRSRSAGIAAEFTQLYTKYQSSERFDARLAVSEIDFSDGNQANGLSLTTDHLVHAGPRWNWRWEHELYYETFDDQSVGYFSPEAVYSLYTIPNVQHLWYERYDKRWSDRFFVGLGQHWQEGFENHTVWFLRYQHDVNLSEYCQWLIGSQYGINYYDEEKVKSLNMYSSMRLRF